MKCEVLSPGVLLQFQRFSDLLLREFAFMGLLMAQPALFALFEKRIEGDDALLTLAQRRFQEHKLLPEYHAGSKKESDAILPFHPFPESGGVVHLPRKLDILKPGNRDAIAALAAAVPENTRRLVLHDQEVVREDFEGYVKALRDLDHALGGGKARTRVYLEYAVGLEPDLFCRVIEAAADFPSICSCIDIGHVGIRRARRIYEQRFPGHELNRREAEDPATFDRLSEVEDAVLRAMSVTLDMIRRLSKLDKPIHFHLHDGHPLVENHYGVPDHKSFLERPMLTAPDGSRIELDTLYGPEGLHAVVETARQHLDEDRLTFTLEIHETLEALQLDPEADFLFGHWADKTNAEKMNHWLDLLKRNATVFHKIWKCREPEAEAGLKR